MLSTCFDTRNETSGTAGGRLAGIRGYCGARRPPAPKGSLHTASISQTNPGHGGTHWFGCLRLGAVPSLLFLAVSHLFGVLLVMPAIHEQVERVASHQPSELYSPIAIIERYTQSVQSGDGCGESRQACRDSRAFAAPSRITTTYLCGGNERENRAEPCYISEQFTPTASSHADTQHGSDQMTAKTSLAGRHARHSHHVAGQSSPGALPRHAQPWPHWQRSGCQRRLLRFRLSSGEASKVSLTLDQQLLGR